MNTSEILALYDQQERLHADLAGAIREDTGTVVRYHYPDPQRYASVLYSRLTDEQIDPVIAEQLAYFQGKAAAVGWTIYSHDTPNLAEYFLVHGFEMEEPGSIMVLDLANLPEALRNPAPHDIRRMPPGDDLHDLQSVLNTAHGRDLSRVVTVIARELRETPQRLSVYVAYADGQPAACGWIRFSPGNFASLWAGGTIPEYRKQGFYSALVAIRAREAYERGYPYLMIDAGPMSQPIVERVGFQYLTTSTEYTYKYPEKTPD